jgi:hypothetical protein
LMAIATGRYLTSGRPRSSSGIRPRKP